ncbi:glyoxylate/hydroxypyruvate reductase A [Tenacibaculum sp. MAR_2009_124]|uniref:2-hydroxyacid dehydrogenase n=1 Tax=Tenacibaculum sp. MAR_2009_124 TaxID=1250059 RepID=UPI000896BC0A|nr:glyoxylate/hydroxypyruvate reductase A [Tenacibaculum sp. MAR_2009_124]SEC24264.1 glyoxylate/hydroxypyruvate reductase A [Tenacibaculum sp. MAR_2009_124]
MSIAIIFNNKNPDTWQKALNKKLTDDTVEIYPNIKNPDDVKFIVCWKPEEGVISKFKNVKVIQSVGASVEHITNTQKIDSNTVVTRIIDHNLSMDMFEFLLSSILFNMKNLDYYSQQKQLQNWSPRNYKAIKEVTVCILGLGEIGSFVSEKLSNVGFSVKGWSNSVKNIAGVQSYQGEKGLYHSIEDVDYLINLLPLTKQTENILSKRFMSSLKKGAFLINVGRGEHLVEQDLIQLLDSKHLSGALLDVFREEPLPKEHPFWKHPNITITPHVASLTNVNSAIDIVVENYLRFKNNQELLNIVSLKKGY